MDSSAPTDWRVEIGGARASGRRASGGNVQFRGSRVAVVFVLLALAALAAMRIAPEIRPFQTRRLPPMAFFDFRLFSLAVDRFQTSGVLYQTEQPDYFLPGSPVYKYPPPYAALLRPVAGRSLRTATLSVFSVTYAIYLAGLGLLVSLAPGSWPLRVALFLLGLAWTPFHETMSGIQLEAIMVALLALSLRDFGRPFWSGVPLGAAAAFKVYPVLLGLPLLLRRDWSRLAGMVAGGVATLALACLVIPPQQTWVYFRDILPKLGGTALREENIAFAGIMGRTSVRQMLGEERLSELVSASHHYVIESIPERQAANVARALTLAIVLVLLAVTWRATRMIANRDKDAPLVLTAYLAWVLQAMPTSWCDYQTLLLPALLLLGLRVWEPGSAIRWRSAWLLLAAVGCLPTELLNERPDLFYPLRAALSLGVWGLALVMLTRTSTRCTLPSSTSGIVSSTGVAPSSEARTCERSAVVWVTAIS